MNVNAILLVSYVRQGGGDMSSKEGCQPDKELEDAISFWTDMKNTAEEKLKELDREKQEKSE